MNDFMKTILSAVKTWTKGKIKDSTADWNQNDPNSPSYVKNRTHWEEEGREVVFLSETVLDSFEEWEDGIYGTNLFPKELVVGKTYTVILDGVRFDNLVCYDDGDYSVIGASFGDFSRYNFGIDYWKEVPALEFYTISSEASHTISITTLEPVVHKIDKKYLPEIDISSKMDANNPVGTGSFSMNRRADTAVGNYSHAEGYDTTASGNYSHAEGNGTTAAGMNSHAEGFETTAFGSNSHTEGADTSTALNAAASSTSNSTAGFCAHAEGYGSVATGAMSHAEGNGTTASGFSSHAEGGSTKATSENSHAEGYGTTASGAKSHAEGQQTTASKIGSHAEGISTIASGQASHAEGYSTEASGRSSHAEGEDTTASGSYSHAEGLYNKASGESSHVEGGGENFGVGKGNTASGRYSHAEGGYTVASGDYSHSEGAITIASGSSSHAEGGHTTASGSSSHAEGTGTTAQRKSQHTQGEYNILDTEGTATTRGKYAHIVGNGTSDTARSNAHTLDWNGVGWYQGGLQVGGNAQDDGARNVLLEGDAIPVPTTAIVGQTIVVKAIDENGKPTEWECAELPKISKSYFTLTDHTSGEDYVVYMNNGSLVSELKSEASIDLDEE